MPLRALIDDIEIISTYLTSNDWDELKNRIKQKSLDVIISQTEKKGYLRTSKNGLQHFVHKKGEAPEDYKTETPQLLFIKSQVLLGSKVTAL
jgi:predicted transcriptional regulator of viral defense system